MAKVLICEIDGSALDWAVAQQQGIALRHASKTHGCYRDHQCEDDIPSAPGYTYNPSTDWAHGGPIVDEMIRIGYTFQKSLFDNDIKAIRTSGGQFESQFGPTVLIAAMRCFISSDQKDWEKGVIEVPDDLVETSEEAQRPRG